MFVQKQKTRYVMLFRNFLCGKGSLYAKVICYIKICRVLTYRYFIYVNVVFSVNCLFTSFWFAYFTKCRDFVTW
jgi:hypothetical protein